MTAAGTPVWRTALFVALVALVASPWGSAALGLALGVGLALTVGTPFPDTSRVSRTLLQVCVVLLGLGVDLGLVLDAGRRGLLLAAVGIAATLGVGALLGRWLGVERGVATLVSAGTAICGGSAIAAVGSAVGATQAQLAVSMGTVFVLNAAGLWAFPPLGHLLGLSQDQFGIWSGIAIHDVSSVVGAAAAYGDRALQVATAVKLSRVLWIVPVTAVAAGTTGHAGKKASPPWFIGGFLLASLARSVVPGLAEASPPVVAVARSGFAVVLFLVGTGLSVAALKQVGWRALAQGALLWVFSASLALVGALLSAS